VDRSVAVGHNLAPWRDFISRVTSSQLSRAVLLVTCERCHKKLRTYAGLKDHWISHHPNAPLPSELDRHVIEEKELGRYTKRIGSGRRSRRPLAIAAVLVAIALLGLVTYYMATQNSTQTTALTSSGPFSNIVWNKQQFLLNSTFSSIQAFLSPLSKIGYMAYGHIEIVRGCVSMNATSILCPSIQMIVVNRTGLLAWQSEMVPSALIYGHAEISSPNKSASFTLTDLDYNGAYYFMFVQHYVSEHVPTFPTPIIAITLTETWTGTQTQIVRPLGYVLMTGILNQCKPFIPTF
jgi:hypothetical protein